MESTTVKLYSLNYGNVRTYLAASLFIVGNILFPQFFHLIPQGGITWLPIYFFTLIGAYKYGWKVGLLTAVLSPIINSLLFGMPMPDSSAGWGCTDCRTPTHSARLPCVWQAVRQASAAGQLSACPRPFWFHRSEFCRL